MVGLFASLKWTLVTSRLRRSSRAVRAWTIVLLVVVLAVLLFIAFGLSQLRRVPDVAPLVVTGLYVAQLLGWALMPLVAFGVDETVDPQRFALLPLRAQTLQRGLLVTAVVGWLPVANIIVMIGAVIGTSSPWALLPVALIAAGIQLITCVVLSRAAATAMSSLMASRRGRDLGVLVGFVLVAGYVALSALLNSGSGQNFLTEGAGRAAKVLGWTPPGALASLPYRLATGQYGAAALGLVIALVALGLVWWWWGRALHVRLTTVSSTSESGGAGASTLSASAGSATGTAAMARLVARRDAVLSWRDPMRRLPWLIVLFMAVFWPLVVFRGAAGGLAVFGVILGSLMAGSQSANQFGVEGSGLWLHLTAYADRARARGEVLGHAAAAILPGAVCVLIALVTVSSIGGDWTQTPAAAGVCLAALLGACAISSWVSASLPFAMPQSRKSLFASSVPGQKGRTSGAQVSILLGGLVSALPAAGLAVVSALVDPLWGWLALAVGLLSGAVMLLVAIPATADRYLATGPEILAVVSAGDRV